MPKKTVRTKIESKDIQGLKYFDRLAPLLERLHDVGTERDRAGNRQLHMDEYCQLVLLFLFSPVLTSLRSIQQASDLQKVQEKLSCPRASLGSLSEATDVFDPERLREVISELSGQLQPAQRDKRLQDFKLILTAVDGTVIKTLATIATAAYATSPQDGRRISKWRLHTHFEIDRHVPTRIDVTGGANKGDQDERYVLGQHLQPDRCYLLDRGYAKFALFNAIVEAKSSYVCRVRDNSSFEITEERPLTQEAQDAQVVGDYLVTLGKNRPAKDRPSHPVRLVIVKTTPHVNRGKYGGGSTGNASDGYLRIATNMLDVPAEIIARIYQYRWSIEIFFRFLKQVLGCRHLLSTDPVGVELQAYCAIIACLLISLWTGRKPTKRTYEMICHYLIGWASEQELLAHLEKLKRDDA